MNLVTQPDVDLDDLGRLVMSRDEGDLHVKASRSFPWSTPDRFVVLRDYEGNEVACIDDLSTLPARSRGAIEAWLQRHTFVPRIQRVRQVRPANAATLFDVETDRGDRTIVLREREDLRPLHDGRTLIRDPDGQTYELPPLDDLDDLSRRELAQIL
ncbi:MAG: DUF1854 domain-containing protein [Planctomycetota bacterium]